METDGGGTEEDILHIHRHFPPFRHHHLPPPVHLLLLKLLPLLLFSFKRCVSNSKSPVTYFSGFIAAKQRRIWKGWMTGRHPSLGSSSSGMAWQQKQQPWEMVFVCVLNFSAWIFQWLLCLHINMIPLVAPFNWQTLYIYAPTRFTRVLEWNLCIPHQPPRRDTFNSITDFHSQIHHVLTGLPTLGCSSEDTLIKWLWTKKRFKHDLNCFLAIDSFEEENKKNMFANICYNFCFLCVGGWPTSYLNVFHTSCEKKKKQSFYWVKVLSERAAIKLKYISNSEQTFWKFNIYSALFILAPDADELLTIPMQWVEGSSRLLVSGHRGYFRNSKHYLGSRCSNSGSLGVNRELIMNCWANNYTFSTALNLP